MSQVNATLAPTFGMWRTVGRLCLDTNAVIGLDPDAPFPEAERRALVELVELHSQCRVLLAKTDLVDRERPADRREAFDVAALFDGIDLVEVLGPRLLADAHGRAAQVLEADEQRQERMNDIIGIRPGRNGANDRRDAEHVATATRYGFDGFVTTDRRLLRRARQLSREAGSFRVMSPSDAVAWLHQEMTHRAAFWVSWDASA
jgi:predicted nucleic acid-binding protein